MEDQSAFRHVNSILRVFRRRGAGTPEFAEWLATLFGPMGTRAREDLSCRHGQGEVHDVVEIFDWQPCWSAGTRDAGKAPKLVVQRMREQARVFLAANGYVADLDWSQPLPTVNDFVHATGARRAALQNQWSALTGLCAELDSDPVTQDARDLDGPHKRSISTGVRTYVMTYLRGLRDDLDALEEGIRTLYQLQTNGDMFLHGCGCGQSYLGDGTLASCVEPSHLTFGSRQANANHVHYHFVLGQLDRAGYCRSLGIMRDQCTDAENIM